MLQVRYLWHVYGSLIVTHVHESISQTCETMVSKIPLSFQRQAAVDQRMIRHTVKLPLIARFTWPTWGPPGAGRTQVGPMWVPCKLISGSHIWIPNVRKTHYSHVFGWERVFALYSYSHIRKSVLTYSNSNFGHKITNLFAKLSPKSEIIWMCLRCSYFFHQFIEDIIINNLHDI